MRRRVSHITLGLFLIGTLFGCDSSEIDPFENDGRYFTVYGFLDPFSVEQELRVVPIRRALEDIRDTTAAQARINAFVTTTDLDTGETIVWQHTLTEVSLEQQYVHVFKAHFIPRPQHTYRLRVEQANGAAAEAQTFIPQPGQAQVALLDLSPDSLMLDVLLPHVHQVWAVQTNLSPVGASRPIPTLHGRLGTSTSEGWRFQINLVEVYRNVVERAGSSLLLEFYGIQVDIIAEDWPLPPSDSLDLNTLAQPGFGSNVEGGYGYFGSVGFYIEDWRVAPELQARLDQQL